MGNRCAPRPSTNDTHSNAHVAPKPILGVDPHAEALSCHLMTEPAWTQIVVPIRSFGSGKSRLSALLSPTQRRVLSISLAAKVIQQAQGCQGAAVAVLSRDEEVAQWCESEGVHCLVPPIEGLNQAAAHGFEFAGAAGAERFLCVHSDLADPCGLAELLSEEAGSFLVPDHLGLGTNVLAIETTHQFTFHYGPDSRRLHCEQALKNGFSLREIHHGGLANDIDSPQDYQRYIEG